MFIIRFKKFLNLVNYQQQQKTTKATSMLSDLKQCQDSLMSHQSLLTFYSKHPLPSVLTFLNKSKKQQTQTRIRYLLLKTCNSLEYKSFLLLPLCQQLQTKQQFIQYLRSEQSQEYFQMLLKREDQVYQIMKSQPSLTCLVMSMVSMQYGVKIVGLWKRIYKKKWNKDDDLLFTKQIKEQLYKGIGLEEDGKNFVEGVDTIVQMRFAQIIVAVGILGGKCFAFVESLISKVLELYKTQDILLKINLVQVVSMLGQGVQTSNLLKDHHVWKYIQKDATDKEQDFYIRKFLLILLVQMWNQEKYEMSFKIQKQLQGFLITNINLKGEYQQAAIDIIACLLKQYSGSKMVVKNSLIFNPFISLARATDSSIKQPFLNSLLSVASLNESPTISKPLKKRLLINILNCIGNPSLTTGLSQNLDSNTIMIEGLKGFAQWFATYLGLPFVQLQEKLIDIFIHFIEVTEIAEVLFQNQNTTKYLLRPLNTNSSDKTLREKKNLLLNLIVKKGKNQWKGHQLEEYSRMLEKELTHTKMDVQYALGVQ